MDKELIGLMCIKSKNNLSEKEIQETAHSVLQIGETLRKIIPGFYHWGYAFDSVLGYIYVYITADGDRLLSNLSIIIETDSGHKLWTKQLEPEFPNTKEGCDKSFEYIKSQDYEKVLSHVQHIKDFILMGNAEKEGAV